MQDMIRLEKLKKLIFWDYNRVEKVLQNMQDKRLGRTPRHDIKIHRS